MFLIQFVFESIWCYSVLAKQTVQLADVCLFNDLDQNRIHISDDAI